MWDAIKRLAVRGAPAIGVAAAFGVVLGVARQHGARRAYRLPRDVAATVKYLGLVAPHRREPLLGPAAHAEAPESLGDRPVPALRSRRLLDRGAGRVGGGPPHLPRARPPRPGAAAGRRGRAHALQRRRPRHGRLRHGARGLLRRAGGRQALPRLRRRDAPAATRAAASPRGSCRTAAWTSRSICDNMAGAGHARGRIQMVFVGADRIARQRRHGQQDRHLLASRCWRDTTGIPFYVVAPISTFDLSTPDGAHIPDRAARPARKSTARLLQGPTRPRG